MVPGTRALLASTLYLPGQGQVGKVATGPTLPGEVACCSCVNTWREWSQLSYNEKCLGFLYLFHRVRCPFTSVFIFSVPPSSHRWTVLDPPDWLAERLDAGADGSSCPSWGSLNDVLDPSRDQSRLTQLYRQYIEDHIEMNEKSLIRGSGAHGRGGLAVAIIEPLLQGAGGMLLVDPQFQRAMVQVGGIHAEDWGELEARKPLARVMC